MGGCASKPKDLDSGPQPGGETVPKENNNNGGEIKKEKPSVDLSEPAQEAPKSEGPSSESNTAEAEAVHGESKPCESENKVEAANEKKKEEVDVAEKPKVEEDKSDAPLVTM